MDYFDLFRRGYKPAIYDAMSPVLEEHLPALKREYPYIDQGIALNPESTTYMFFQTENLKNTFEKQMEGMEVGSLEFHRLLGHTLGYPPKAVDFFVRCRQDARLSPLKVGMHYMGVPCNGSVDDLIDNCCWLWNTYTIPEYRDTLEVRIGANFHPVDYKDMRRLEELQHIAQSTVTA